VVVYDHHGWECCFFTLPNRSCEAKSEVKKARALSISAIPARSDAKFILSVMNNGNKTRGRPSRSGSVIQR
jgi:hypothetical protein